MEEITLDGIGGRYIALRRSVEPVRQDVWEFYAELKLPGVQAETLVYESGFSLQAYFRDLADSWRGFDGVKEYVALEGQMEIASKHDRKGTIVSVVVLRKPEPPEWRLEAVFEFGAGAHMDGLARDIERFMSAPSS
jgi:hypothetical protein